MPTSIVWWATSLMPTMPEICLRCSASKMWEKTWTVPWVTSQIASPARSAAVPALMSTGLLP